MAYTFLTRLRVGSKLIDAKGVSRLYRSQISASSLLLLICAAWSPSRSPCPSRRWPGCTGRSCAATGILRVLGAGVLLVIDFRYHVVSIVAVFLALTVGLVLGASFLSSAQIDILKGQITSANNAKSGLENDNRALADAKNQLQDYIDETKQNLVNNQLYNDYVVVVRTPGSNDGSTDAVVSLAKRASATITADVTINATFADPSSAEQLATLVLNYTPTGQILGGNDVVSQAMSLLAEALTAQATGATGATATPTPTIAPKTMTADWSVTTLKAFRDIGVITVNTMPSAATMTKPTAAFISAPDKAATDAQNAMYLMLAQTLHTAGVGPVIGGTSIAAGTGGLIAGVLKNASAARTVSTVNDMNQTTGQVAVVFVLYQESANPQAAAGHYGTTGSTDGLLPKLPSLPAVPSPSAG